MKRGRSPGAEPLHQRDFTSPRDPFSLTFAADTDPSLLRLADERGREVGAGVNWYINGHSMKLQADDAARFGKETAPLYLTRLQ